MGRRGTETMNQKQRKEWDNMIDLILKADDFKFDETLFLTANAYILKLERELQNIKAGKRIARVLMKPQENA
jgi:hypothetical protein